MLEVHAIHPEEISTRVADVLSHPLGAFVASIVTLYLVGTLFPPYWAYIFSAVIAWISSDIIISWFIERANGGVRIRLINWLFQKKGTAYIAFFAGIVVATTFSTAIANFFLQFSPAASTGEPLLIASFLLGVLVFADL